MNINNYLDSNFAIDNLIGKGMDADKMFMSVFVKNFNQKYDSKLPKIQYVVDFVGFSILNAIEKYSYGEKLINSLPKNTQFFYTKLFHFNKKGGSKFEIKPQLIGFLTKQPVEIDGYYLLSQPTDLKYFYVKNEQ